MKLHKEQNETKNKKDLHCLLIYLCNVEISLVKILFVTLRIKFIAIWYRFLYYNILTNDCKQN